MRVIITSATAFETAPALQAQHTTGDERISVSFHQSGVGMLASAVSLTRLALEEKPGLIIQAGIAGCFDTSVELGTLFVINNEIQGDTGVQEGGEWKDLFDLNLAAPNGYPFANRMLPNPWLAKYNLLNLPEATSVTVNEITTSAVRIKQIVQKYSPTIESMEGAPLHYVCGIMNIPFIQIRAISNYIGERNKQQWKMKEAITNLNKTLLQYIEALKVSGF